MAMPKKIKFLGSLMILLRSNIFAHFNLPPTVIYSANELWVLSRNSMLIWFNHNKSCCYPALISPSDFILCWDVKYRRPVEEREAKCFFLSFLLSVFNVNMQCSFQPFPAMPAIFEFCSGVNLCFNISPEVFTLARLQTR